MKSSSWIAATIVAARTGTRGHRAILLGALCSFVMAVSARTAQAAEPVPIFIDIHDFTVSDVTAEGTFESTGAIATSGLESQVFRVEGWSLHCVHTLVAKEGTIVIHSQCNMITNLGQWRVVSGTGAYAGLKGNGSLLMVFNPDDPAEAHELLVGWVY